jgi:outer membrane cobalamin receptor
MYSIKQLLFLVLVPMMCMYSQTNISRDSTKTYLFDPVTITATRTASNRSVVAPSISIVPQEVLTANPGKSILSLISQEVPGVYVQERGILGFGASTSSAGQTRRFS